MNIHWWLNVTISIMHFSNYGVLVCTFFNTKNLTICSFVLRLWIIWNTWIIISETSENIFRTRENTERKREKKSERKVRPVFVCARGAERRRGPVTLVGARAQRQRPAADRVRPQGRGLRPGRRAHLREGSAQLDRPTRILPLAGISLSLSPSHVRRLLAPRPALLVFLSHPLLHPCTLQTIGRTRYR